jgi:hypothetical protein
LKVSPGDGFATGTIFAFLLVGHGIIGMLRLRAQISRLSSSSESDSSLDVSLRYSEFFPFCA